MQLQIPLSSLERQHQIVQYLQRRQRATVLELASHFAISEATVRRDLEALSGQGEVERFHGGARMGSVAPPELPVLKRQNEERAAKAAIGQVAAALVRDGETIFISSGTTALQVAYHLRQRQGLTVITNSILVINALRELPSITVVGLGGILRHSEQSMIGHLTESGLKEVHADRIIFGIHAIDSERGLTNDYLPETMTDRAILRAGREIIIVADHTKCGRVSTAFVAPVTAIHVLVTDEQTPALFVQQLNTLGIRVIQTPVGSE
jgi:DeoR/GlpR family transcriptional regulator of sugar metabolism